MSPKGSWVLDISIFITDRLAYHLNGAACFGRQLADLSNSSVSMLGIQASMGLEYYIPLGKNQLSAAIGIGGDSFGYFHDNAAARYDNLVLPISATFWHRRIGYSLAYEWCIGKHTPDNNMASLPSLAPSFITAGVRFR